MREYLTLQALRRGEVVNLDGIKFVMDEGDLRPGDLYIAERNTGPKFLTVERVVMYGDSIDYVVPTTNDYGYDGGECVKVKEAA